MPRAGLALTLNWIRVCEVRCGEILSKKLNYAGKSLHDSQLSLAKSARKTETRLATVLFTLYDC